MQVKAKRLTSDSILFGCLLVMICGPLHAEDGTIAQRRARGPDVFRLCAEFIPDHAAIASCLETNKTRLNPDCRAVFEGSEIAEPAAQHSSARSKSDLAGVRIAVTK